MFKKTKNSLAISLSVAMLATLVTIPRVASAATATQLSGKDRYQTAIKIVEAGWTSSENAVITTGEVMADALAAAPLAYAKGQAPILLTKTNEIPEGVMTELKTLGVKNVYIVGGVGAVSKAVADKLAEAGLTIQRIEGKDRFATSLAVAKVAFGTNPAEVVIANGISYADALSVSSIAARKGMPILLVNNSALSAEQTSYIAGKNVYAVGGIGVLNAAVVTKTNAQRLSGADRYETNAAILAKFKQDYSNVYIAKGTPANLVDALAGSVLAAKGNNPVVLVEGDKINTKLAAVVSDNIASDSKVVRLGGTVTLAAADAIEALKLQASAVTSVADITETKTVGDAYVLPTTVKATLSDKTTKDLAITWDKVASTKVGGTYTFTGTLTMVDGIVNTGNVSVTATLTVNEANLAVQSVNAINAKTIEIAFNNAVDTKTLMNASKDVIKVSAGTGAVNAGTITQKLSTDGKTLTLTASNYFKGNYTVAVPFETVKGIDGQYLEPINKAITVNDIAAPVLSSVTATVKATTENIKLITMTFNEDINTIDNVKINGVNYVPTKAGNVATIAVDLDATKAYDVTVVNATDVTSNLKDIQTATLKLTVDNNAPSITSVVATGENTLKVTVDEALASPLVVTGKVGSYTTNVVSSAVVNPDNNKEYVVTLNKNYLFKNGNTDIVTLTVAEKALKDSLGNTNVAAITKTAVVTKDAVAPNVAKVENTVVSDKVTGFVVTYNKAVQLKDISKVSVVNSKGEILAFNSLAKTPTLSEDGLKVTFTFVNAIAVDKYGFDFAEGFVSDKSLTENKSAQYAFTVDVTDAAKPVVTAFTIADAKIDSNVITVDFGAKVKATGTGSALNPASYQINGTVLPANTVIAFNKSIGDAKYQTGVDITLPADFVKANEAKAIFRVTGVQTLDNKVSNAYIALLDIKDNTAPVAQSFVATTLDTITVTYSEALQALVGKNVAMDEINLFDASGAPIAFTASTVNAAGKLVLTVADSSVVTKLTTVTATTANLKDAADNIQKVGLTVIK
ncbi:cell wall-binding repeat-containing protein [Clostridium sp.]|uniref:cell wall-binding repeat-containing protein n=1 Tax=Clostridium sp. TaxID=1506 RepID=UPI003D6D06F4